MKFQARLVLLVTALLSATIAVDTGVHAWKTYDALLQGAQRSAERVARLMARSAAFGTHVGRDLETVTGDMMVAQARLTALYVAAAERAGQSPEIISRTLARIAETSLIDEFWITDEKGHAYIHSVEGVDFTFDPDPERQPQAHLFWPLLTGASDQVVQEARRRELDDKVFKYVAVTGADHRRIVELGIHVDFLDQLSARMGLNGLIGALVGEGDINAIWVLNRGLDTLAHASLYGTPANPEPNSLETQTLSQVMAQGESAYVMEGDQLTVITPVRDGETVIGAALVRMSTDYMDRALRSQMWTAAVTGLAIILLGAVVAVALARRQSRPIEAMTKAARAIEKGSFDPATLEAMSTRRDEFGTLAKVFVAMAREVAAREERLDGLVRARTAEIEHKHTLLMKAHRRIDEELEIARSFQIAMLPRGFIQDTNHEVFGFMVPAREVGGDFYDHFPLDEHRLCLVVGDVSGKGVPAALFMVQARSAIRAAVAAGQGPAEALASVNDALIGNNPLELFVTVFLSVYDSASGVLTFANAGHPPPLVVDPDGMVSPLPRPGGMVVAALPGLRFGEACQTLQPGQSLVIYSDGITEGMDESGALFGDARLSAVLKQGLGLSAQAMAYHAAKAVADFAGSSEQADDITCLVLRCLRTVSAIRQGRLELVFADSIEDIPRVIAAAETFCTSHGVTPRVFGTVQLALDEWLANVINHAWSEAGPHRGEVTLVLDDGRLVLAIKDDGPAFNPLERAAPDLDSPLEERAIGGLGIHLIRSMMDEVRYARNQGQNVLTLVKRLEE